MLHEISLSIPAWNFLALTIMLLLVLVSVLLFSFGNLDGLIEIVFINWRLYCSFVPLL